jgi:Fe-S cluster assembly protein SufD
VGQNARLRFVGAQDMNERSWVFGAQRAEVARDGHLDWVVVGFGSGNGKVRTETLLAGEGSHAKVTGAYAPHARQHVDFHTTQEHGAANTTSDLASAASSPTARARCGRMIKPTRAQQTDALQECRNLLPKRSTRTRSGLEIQRRALHARGGDRADRQGAALLPALARAGRGPAQRLVIEGFMSELVQAERPIREAISPPSPLSVLLD